MKKPDSMLREYVNKLSDENLEFVYSRLSQRLCGDLGEALNALSQMPDMDRWLHGSKTAEELYDMADMIALSVEKEYNRRSESKSK